MYFPSEKEFLALTKKGNLIPVYKEILADLETPVSAYLKIAKATKYSFLLESVEGEEKIARFSFLAKDPERILQLTGTTLTLSRLINGALKVESQETTKNPLLAIRKLLKKYHFVSIPQLPSVCGGLFGYMSYDVVRFFEKLPHKPADDLNLPDLQFVLTKDLIVFDHRNHKIKVVSCVEVDPHKNVSEKITAYKKALRKIDQLISELSEPLIVPKNNRRRKAGHPIQSCVTSNFTKAQFTQIVNEAKKQIRAGEIIQVVLSQRFSMTRTTDPFNIYRALRILNPSSYMYYLHFDGMQVIGSSPELLVRCENGVVETRPIAGTRPRGTDEKKDERLVADLLADPKEKAEHIMLVDLGRNDLGRVCIPGSVHVSEFMKVEKYSHVMHIVSNVTGKLKPGKDGLDVLQAAFPAGTLSGAPKIRAMEIIDTLETVARGPYGGCIGYFTFSGNLDTCITIRTIIAANNKTYIQAGAGIVADSQPAKEYQETVNKAQAQLTAVRLAVEETY